MKGYPGFIANRAKDLAKPFFGRPFRTPSLVATTLGADDADIAARQLELIDQPGDPSREKEFAARFADWNGSRAAFAFMAGRAALGACIHALDLRPGDEVVLPGYTCVVVPNAFRQAGIEVAWCDIELDTFGPDAASLERAITPRTRAVLVQHLYGLVCRDYASIMEIARARGLRVIEDCAQSTGAEFRGVKVGNLGDVAFYSTEVSKVFTTVMGGLAVTNNDRLAGRLAAYHAGSAYPERRTVEKLLNNVIFYYHSYSDPGRWWKKEWISLRQRDWRYVPTTAAELEGGGSELSGRRMPSPLAEVGLNQLDKVDACNRERREAARKWDGWCEDHGYRKPLVTEDSLPVFLRYPVLVEPELKSDTDWAWRELGVRPGLWFESNLHPSRLPVKGCPAADEAVRRCVNLPTILEGR